MIRFLDTCTCIDFLRGRLPLGLEALREVDPRSIRIPSLVSAELRLGALKSAHPKSEMCKVEQFLAPLECVPFDSLCAQAYARVRTRLEKAGTLIGPNDLIIAATALAHQGILVTRNVDEFSRVPGLSVESWHEVEV